MAAIVTLTTDFGSHSPYVAELKGAILSVDASIPIVDVTHEIQPQCIEQAAWVLAEVVPAFPSTTVHLAVVDPEDGSSRSMVYVESDMGRFVAPDNGLLTLVAQPPDSRSIIRIEDSSYWRKSPPSRASTTFQARDIMAPIAAQLARGLTPSRIGPFADEIVELPFPTPRDTAGDVGGGLEGLVMFVDRFGNLITNISADDLSRRKQYEASPAAPSVTVGGATIKDLSQHYAETNPGDLAAYVGSSGYLEIAKVCGNAAKSLNCGRGDTVQVRWNEAIGN